MNNQVGEFAQAFSASTEWFQSAMCSPALLFGHLPRPIQPIYSRERDLLLPGIFTGSLAKLFGGLLDVQYVIDDLEREPHVLPV